MERKKKICKTCEKPSFIWAYGNCKDCDGKARQKKQSSSPAKSPVKEQKAALNVFFASQALIVPERCENCGERLILRDSWDRRKVTCHILPKTNNGGFPTVAIHPQNRVFMCCDSGCYGHGKWDHGDASDRIKMKVYNLAIERFRRFEDQLTPKELIKAYKYLNLTGNE